MRIPTARACRMAAVICCLAWFASDPAWATGKYIRPTWRDFRGRSFSTTDYLIGTYYFDWYNVHTTEHFINPDGSDALTDHPSDSLPVPLGPGGYAARPPAAYASPPFFSYDDPAWHARECRRMAAAGVDFLMPVYWGVPGVEDWNTIGLRNLEIAMNGLEAKRQRFPQVGIFYDTTTLWGVDLTTRAGKDRLYGTIRDFYSYVPPKRWARMNGRAIVWFYWSGWPSRIDPGVLSEASNRFARDFGGVRLFFVGDNGWRSAGTALDYTYAWGAAVSGTTVHDVTAVGAGYDDRGVTYRTSHIVVPRRKGEFYQEAWESAHASGRRLIAIETWNEYHEATDIAPSYEYGWLYVDMTAREAVRHRFPMGYVRQAYRYLLGRAPSASGYATYTSAMDRGTPPGAVRDSLLNSASARARTSDPRYVTFLYNHYLHRAPEPGGYAHWLGRLRSGAKRSDVRNAFLDSAEAKDKIGDRQFVTELYRQILLREPEPAGFDFWMGQLASGQARAWVRDGFVNSIELKYHDLSTLTSQEATALFDYSGWR